MFSWLIVDLMFLLSYILFAAAILAPIGWLYDKWFRSGHPCRCDNVETFRPSSTVPERKSVCPRHNLMTVHRYESIAFVFIMVVLMGGFVAMLELYHHLR